jgi:pheromone shutdown-related protein TraB
MKEKIIKDSMKKIQKLAINDITAPKRSISKKQTKVSGPVWKKRIGRTNITFLGTAHISAQSVADVDTFISQEKPDVVCVELCEARYKAMMDSERWTKLDIVQVIKEKKLYLLMSSILLSVFQKKMGEGTGIKPGQEILTAIQLTAKKKIPLELVDRNIQITLKRAWVGLGYFKKITLISELLASMLIPMKLDEEEIEKLKQKDVLETLFDDLPSRYKFIRDIIVDERDKYLAQKVNDVIKKYPKAKNILVVVGAGHLKGIKNYLNKQQDLTSLEQVPQKSKVLGLVKFFAPIVIILGLFYYFSNSGDPQKIMQNLMAWVLIKAFCSGIIALALWAHPLAIAGAFLTAPISNFNPILKPGWVAALVEAKYHKPQVADFERLVADSQTLKGVFKNKVIRIFNLFIFPQLGSSLGTGLALWYIAK